MLPTVKRACLVWFTMVLTGLLSLTLPLERASIAQTAFPAWPEEWQADSAFSNLWSHADGPLASGSVARSWLWGPLPFAVVNEPYAESSTGKRLVQYFDKARMEINDPAQDRSSPWFITSGLLVYEMVTGKVQTGNTEFDILQPANVPVAGDAASPDAPTFASFAGLIGPADDATGKPVAQHIAKDGVLSVYSPTGEAALLSVLSFDSASRHNVPKVFSDWLNQSGTVLEGGRLVQARLIDPLFVLGRPITEAYWASIVVAGRPTNVLVQLFERRALTYNPNNPPEWRVEMANVGTAYYDWRYRDAPPDAAIAGEVTGNGVAVHGWNWPAQTTIGLQVDSPAGGTPLAGPSSVQADAAGRFVFIMLYNKALQDALQSGAKLQITARSSRATAALPLAGKPAAVSTNVEGTIALVEFTNAGARLVVSSLDGRQWLLVVPSTAVISTSEGSPTSSRALDAGIAVLANCTTVQGIVTVSKMTLLSYSRTPARVSYEWSSDGSSIFVAGTGWPGERDVSFAMGTADGPQSPLATRKSDSRGNLTESIRPPVGFTGQTRAWLFATASDPNGSRVQIGVPVVSLGSPGAPSPTQLYINSQQGSEQGGTGEFCTSGKCFPSSGVALPADTLTVKPGDVLGLRAQEGANPLLAMTAVSLSAQLYLFPTGVAPQFFVPQGTPISASGDLPGRPFSVTLPTKLTSGKYALLVSVQWPATTGKNTGVYGFALQIP